MKITKIDTSMWDKGLEVWKEIFRYRKEKTQPSASQLKYFELYIEYLESLKSARNEGKFIVVHATSIPAEIFAAIDVTPLLAVGACFAISQCLKNFKTTLEATKEFGITNELCSGHRNIIGHTLMGWFPKANTLAVDIGCGCDAFSNSLKITADLYDVPHYHVDAPYRYSEEAVKYLANEFKNLINFLENETGRKFDWDRLRESIKNSQKMIELWHEVRELRKAVPSPMDNRRAWETNWINWFFSGSQKGIDYWTVLRDELKERVSQGRSAYPGVAEKFRVLDLFMAPAHYLKMLEWMQKDYGVNIVSELLIHYQDFEMDPSKPLESLARRWFKGPLWNVLSGSTEIMMEVAVKEAQEMNADGAIWWDQFSCRQAGAVKLVQDALAEKVGIPTARIKCDITDPSYTTQEEMDGEFLDYLKVLEIRKEFKA